jgi:hypothetical protein
MNDPIEISPHDKHETQDGEVTSILIPMCCREGWDNCPHVVQPIKRKKRNIGL